MVLEGLVQQVPFFSAIIQSPEIRSKSDLFATGVCWLRYKTGNDDWSSQCMTSSKILCTILPDAVWWKHKYLLLTTKQAKCTNIYRIDGWSRLRLDVERTSRCFFIEIFLFCCLKQLVHELISVSFWSTLFPKLGLFLSGKPDTLFFQADGLRWLPAWRSADFRTMV